MPKDKDRRPSDREIWKGIRKSPNPPGQTFQPKDRALREDDDNDEMEQWRGWHGEDFEDFEG